MFLSKGQVVQRVGKCEKHSSMLLSQLTEGDRHAWGASIKGSVLHRELSGQEEALGTEKTKEGI